MQRRGNSPLNALISHELNGRVHDEHQTRQGARPKASQTFVFPYVNEAVCDKRPREFRDGT